MGSEQHSNTEEVRPIAKRRIEFDPEAHDPATVELAEAVRALLSARTQQQPTETVRAAGAVERATKRAAGSALLSADGVISRRDMAELYGTAHDAINRRIATAKADQNEED